MRQWNAARPIAVKTALALVLTGALAACGQQAAEGEPAAPEAAAEEPAAVEPASATVGWQEYTFDDLKLAKSFPAEPTRADITYWEWPHTDREPEVVGEAPGVTLSATANDIDYIVTVVPRPDMLNMSASMVGECAYLTEESGVEQKNTFTEINNGNRSVYGHQVVVDLHDMSGRMHNGCYFENGNFYIFSATVKTANGNPDAPEAQEFVTSGRFLDVQ